MLDLAHIGYLALIIVSLLLTIQSTYSAALMLYAWEDEDKGRNSRVPTTYAPPKYSFTVLLPARHEEAVIQDTIQRVVDLNYPRELVQILVVIEPRDSGTIDQVVQKLKMLHQQNIHNVQLISFYDPPINKPHGLNKGLYHSTGDIVTIFDAEDEPHSDILQIVNTIMSREDVPVVQCGVQLMNYADKWFSALNVLEYFFWFKSRLHFHSAKGMVPLGGNTVFMKRALLNSMGGWNQDCLTEDAEIGIRLSAAKIPIRVVYDDAYVTKEETPPTVNQFIKQRTRWNQGFLQVLKQGDWLHLPRWSQRFLALYTLAFPLLQALMLLYWPVSLLMIFFVKVPAWVALVSSLPLYMLVLQFLISVIGLYEFAAVHHLKTSVLAPLRLLMAFLPYQWMLSYAALRAAWRQLKGLNNWEKTAHIGAHRAQTLARMEEISGQLANTGYYQTVDNREVQGS